MNIFNIDEIKSPVVGLVCSFLGIVINFLGAAFILRLAKKSASPALKAEGIHFILCSFRSLHIRIKPEVKRKFSE
jgi:divalent metal cation (Fe/Co/Zn/Cd) transporter